MEKSADADLLREMIGFAAQRLMELEVEGLTGAAYGEKNSERLAQRNGYRDRVWETRAGAVELRIPKLRKGCYFVNIREALTNPADGSQIDDYQVADGVHFNPAGYRAWAEYLATHTVWNRRSIYSGQNPYYIYGA